jgi:hypothetical protein
MGLMAIGEKTMLRLSLTKRLPTVPAFLFLLASALGSSAQDQAAAAAPAKVHTKNFSFKTDEGLSIVPLPDKAWRQVLEEETHEEMEMGTYTESWKKVTIFLAPAAPGAVTKLIEVSANASVLEVRDVAPDDFCYAKQRKWKWHKQISAITADTFCWGVRYMNLTEILQTEAWQLLAKKMEKSGTPLPVDATATQVRFYRSVRGQFPKIDYYFLGPNGGKPWHWNKARAWAKGLVSRVTAGFEGKLGGGR